MQRFLGAAAFERQGLRPAGGPELCISRRGEGRRLAAAKPSGPRNCTRLTRPRTLGRYNAIGEFGAAAAHTVKPEILGRHIAAAGRDKRLQVCGRLVVAQCAPHQQTDVISPQHRACGRKVAHVSGSIRQTWSRVCRGRRTMSRNNLSAASPRRLSEILDPLLVRGTQ